MSLIELLRDLTPTRRKSRFGDIDYDFEHGVDTTWANVPLRTRWREWLSGGQYQPTEPGIFHEILCALPFPLDGLTFIDLGCGKGRTLLIASEYPFNRIVGVELLDELTRIARANIAHYGSPTQKCFNLEARTASAQNLVFPPEPSLLYLFNPFPAHVLRTVLLNIHQSMTVAPRELYIIYHNLEHESVFAEQGWLEELVCTPQYAVYSARADV